MNCLRILASRPLETLLIACLALCVLVSVRTLSRARRVLRNVRAHSTPEPAALLWSTTQVRIEWCILAAQLVAFALSLHRIYTTAWDDNRGTFLFHVYGSFRVTIALLLAWCVLANKRTCDRLQSLSRDSSKLP